MGDLGLVGGEDPQGADIAGRLGKNDIAGVDEDPGHQVERLLRPGGHDNVVRMCGDPLERHDLKDLLAQRGVALSGAVLQSGEPLRGQHPRDSGSNGIHREGREVRHAAGEGDDLRTRSDGEQSANLGGGHAGGALGVGLHPGIKTRALRTLARGVFRAQGGGARRTQGVVHRQPPFPFNRDGSNPGVCRSVRHVVGVSHGGSS